MFYCEQCRKRKKWPGSISKSLGPCECCGKVRECHERPSSSLPIPRKRVAKARGTDD